MKSFEERVTPEISGKLEEEARQYRDLGVELGLVFREAQEETLESYAAWEEQFEDSDAETDELYEARIGVEPAKRPGGRHPDPRTLRPRSAGSGLWSDRRRRAAMLALVIGAAMIAGAGAALSRQGQELL